MQLLCHQATTVSSYHYHKLSPCIFAAIEEETVFISVPENIINSSFIYTLYTTSALFQVVPPENVANYTYATDTTVLGFAAPNFDLNNPVRITLQSHRPEEVR